MLQKSFRPMSEYTNISYMDWILERIWSDSSVPSQTQMAYAISVCQILLNLNDKHIKITKKIIKKRFRRNLISFAAFHK